jgi:hypothetical protein
MAETKRARRPVTGRPSEYSPALAELAYKLTLLMATDDEIADCLCISRQTLDAWRKAHPEFLDAITRGKLVADAEVGHALKHRALGYSHAAVKIFMPAGASEPVYAPYTEHYPPDTQAASLWLRNRQPGKWRDRHEHTGADGGPIVVQTVSYSADDPPTS